METQMQRKLLVVLDGGPLDMHVASQAVVLARERRAELRVLYVVCPPPELHGEVIPTGAGLPVMVQEPLAPTAEDSAVSVLERVRSLAESTGVYARVRRLEHPSPAKEIAHQAWTHGCEWILVAVHSDSLWQRLCGRSLNSELLALSKVPVLFCTEDTQRGGRQAFSPAGMHARLRRMELRERRAREFND
jgi:nucleotide-binding universal stress UspA family protein